MKLGGRIIKTGVALTLSLYAAMFFNLEPLIFAALAAVLSVQPSLYRSWQNIVAQLQGNLIGAVLAVSGAYLLGNDPFVIGLVVMIVIGINLQLRIEKSIPLAIVTVIAIMESTTGNFPLYALERFGLIMLGIGSSVFVNVVFLPPKYEEKLYVKMHEANQDVLSYLRSVMFDHLTDKKYREEIKRLQDEQADIEQLYLFYKEERTYFRKVSYSKNRKLILFRKMIQVSQAALSLLQSLNKYRGALAAAPDEFTDLLQRQIEMLTNYHERILLKYEGSLKTGNPEVISDDVLEGRDKVLQNFMEQYKKNQEEAQHDWMHLFFLLALFFDYADELQQLDKLVEGYYAYHSYASNS